MPSAFQDGIPSSVDAKAWKKKRFITLDKKLSHSSVGVSRGWINNFLVAVRFIFFIRG